MKKREFLRGLGLAGLATTCSPVFSANAATHKAGQMFRVRDFGAAGDGQRLDTKEIQQAIDACAQAGGGTVHFSGGNYLSGTLFMRSHVTLHLEAGATLLGSKELKDYPSTIPALRSYTDHYTERSLIYAENAEQIGFEGRGTIDGQGAAFKGGYKVRPYLLRIISCRDVVMSGLTLKNSPMWLQHYLNCDGVRIDGITVRNRCNANSDGIDIDGCRSVRITNCDIGSGDDALVLKSTFDQPCRNVAIANCVLSSDCNAFKMGTESNGGFEDIVVSNLTIYDTRLSGIALELVDGGTLARVSISNITMRDVRSPIFIRLGNRARPFKDGMAKPGIGSLRGISIRDVQATGADAIGNSITGLPGHPAEDISLENIRITAAGGGKTEDAQREVPERETKYPEYKMFGVLPAYGFYCRHVRGVRFTNVRVGVAKPDLRPAWVCDDAEDLEFFGCTASSASGSNPVIRFNNVRNALIHGCRSPETGGSFLRVEGESSQRISLMANDLAAAKEAFELGPGLRNEAVSFVKPE
jgi:polygalacturonase